ncbi:visual pigment-like receptor peropsin [Glandiceps talaboti]
MAYPIFAVTWSPDQFNTETVTTLPTPHTPNLTISAERHLGMAYYTAMGIFLTVTSVVGLTGNVAVMTMLISRQQLKKPFNILLFNLAVSDLGILCISSPMVISSTFTGVWLFGTLGCRIYAASMFFFSISSINTLAIVSYYRLLRICYPLKDLMFTRKNPITFALLCSWMYSLFWCTAPLLGWSKYALDPYETACSIDWFSRNTSAISFNCTIFISCYGAQIILITYSYIRIWKNGFKALERRRGRWKCKRSEKKVIKTQRNLTKMCLWMVISFTVAWTPYSLFSILLMCIGHNSSYLVAISIIPSLFAKSACAVNPLIYAIMHRQSKLCRPWCRWRNVKHCIPFRKTSSCHRNVTQGSQTTVTML